MDIIRSADPSFERSWLQLWRQDCRQHPFYLKWNVEWSKDVAQFQGGRFENLSFVISDGNAPVLGVLMSVQIGSDGKCELAYYGRPILYLESEEAASSQLKKAYKLLRTELETIVEEHAVTSILYRDFLAGGNLSFFGWLLLDWGAKAEPHFTQVIDLSLSEEILRQQIRKSYGSLINWGLKNLEITLFDADMVNKEIVEEFRQLHAQVAGRQTRSLQSWDIQYEMVRSREAFIVLGEQNDELVTAAFFIYSPAYCFYGSSASRRDMFDKPMAHSILWKALLHARNLGCRYFGTGQQLYPQQGEPLPSPKELGISKFKRGFGGVTAVRLNFKLSR